MGKPKPTPVKNQQSISSFFQKKVVNGDILSQQTQNSQNPPPTRTDSNEGENLYDADTGDDDDEPLRPLTNGRSKRQLAETADTEDTEELERPPKKTKGDDNGGSSFFSNTAPRKATSAVTGRSKISPRTERYLYTASSQATPGEPIPEEEEDDAATKAKKKELHEKFVKKLGHPDSLALIKRRNWQIDADTEALDEDAGEGEDDEDETPLPAKTKKKGAKTGKLTPMELQILDIKRKHMDTLLIVEVGYKFKFYGEDARTAAKELSIVCIPGKYRYDERKTSSTLHIRRIITYLRPLRGTSRSIRICKHSRPSITRTCEETRYRRT
jgi:DNA mismatch repair protein MSH3